MKKTFTLIATNKTPERQADAIKHEIKKYLTRERKKERPDKVDFWDFNCKIGLSENKARTVETTLINKMISKYVADEAESFYLEILAKPGYKTPKK